MTSQKSSAHQGIATIALVIIVVLVTIGVFALSQLKPPATPAPGKPTIAKDKPLALDALPIVDQPKPEAILEVTFHYSLNQQPTLAVTATRQLQGYAPRYLPRPEGYTLELLDTKGNSLSKQTFLIPSSTEDIGALNHTISQGQTIDQPEGNFALTVPLTPYTSKIKITDNKGNAILTKNI